MSFKSVGPSPIIWRCVLISVSALFMLLSLPSFAESQDASLRLGTWTQSDLNVLLSQASVIQDAGQRIEFLSGLFLGTAYSHSTLIGTQDRPEVLVVNFQAVDCFTYLDYVEAMRRSASFDEFLSQLKRVRYRNGDVDFEKRNHFFTDWKEFQIGYIKDITEEIGGTDAEIIAKQLNDRGDGRVYISGLPSKRRRIAYIPSSRFDAAMLSMLQHGDYIGIYSPKSGIDVSHTGIVVKKADGLYLRHASASRYHRKVIDQEFQYYIRTKPGIIIFRPIEK